MRTVAPLAALAACTAGTTPAEPDPDPDLVPGCEPSWPAANCEGGCPDAERQAWATGYLDHVSEAWGRPAEPWLTVRRVDVDGVPSRYATLRVLLRAGWVASLYEVRAQLDRIPADAAEAEAAFGRATVPQVDPDAPPRAWSEVEATLADCEAELGVTFADPWCRTYVTLDPDDDDQAGVRFDFFGDPDGAGRYPLAAIYAWGSEPDRCELRQVTTD